MDKKKLLFIKTIFMVLVPLITYFLCQYNDVSYKFTFYIAITLWAVYCWMSNIISPTITAMLLPVLYLLFGVADTQTVFAPWTGTVPWLCLGGLFLGHMLLKCGLALRLSYKCMLLSGGTFIRLLFGIMIAGYAIAPLIPTVLGKCTILFILATGICVALDIPPDSKNSAIIFITCLFAVTGPSYAYMTSCAQVPVAVQLMESASDLKITWFEYAYHNFLPSLVYTIVSFASILLVLRPDKLPGLKTVIEEKYALLGDLSKDEKKAIVILVIILILLVTESVHKINAAWCMMLVAGLTFLPGIRLLQSEDIDEIGFPLLYFLTGAMSVGSVAAEIGIAKEIAFFAAQFLHEGEAAIHITATFFLGTLCVFFLSPTTGLAALGVPLTKIAINLGVDPRMLIYPFFYGSDLYFIPYQYGLLLLLISFKRTELKYLTPVLAVKAVLSILIVLPTMIIYWHFVGLW